MGDVRKPRWQPFAFASSALSRGPGTYQVPKKMYQENRTRLVTAMQLMCSEAGLADPGVALFRGGKSGNRNDTDHEELFRQESYFSYLFGVDEPDWWGTIHLESGKCTLFMPRLPDEYAIWMGKIQGPAHFAEHYTVEEVKYTDELVETLEQQTVHVMHGTNSDSGVAIQDVLCVDEMVPDGCPVVPDYLFKALAECRVCKTFTELDLMRYVSWITSVAHVEVMREAKPGMMEWQLESRFLFHCSFHGGCRHSAYTCICACGPNSAVLHYGHAGAPNDRQLQDGQIALLDMGAEYRCYCSDITCSYPVSGKFSTDQRMAFDAVLEAQRQIFACMKPGVSWGQMHRLMWRVLLQALIEAGVLVGELEDMIQAELGQIFVPCGMGHLIGLDTHDVGGYLQGQPERIDQKGINKLRTNRILKAGMCLTVEPGLYFIDVLLDAALSNPAQSKFFVKEELERFRSFGGVRLEDVVVVTENGIENYTLCPRTVEEIEDVMAGGVWPPVEDKAPWLFRRWGQMDKPSGQMTDVCVTCST